MQIKKCKIMCIWWLLTALSPMLLVSCGVYDFEDLEHFTNTQNASVERLEEKSVFSQNLKYEKYDAKNRRDPFSFIETKSNAKEPQGVSHKNTQEDKSPRDRERLEEYALSSISMVGMLEKRGLIWALVRISDASVLIVRKGSYMGKHQGLVVAINENKILLEENVLDDLGRWVKRKNEITLTK